MIETASAEVRFAQLKDQFLSSIGHELRTPLTAIRTALELLESGAVDASSDKGRHLLALAVSNSIRLQKLVLGLLDINRLRAGRLVLQKEQCDMQIVARDACARVTEKLGSRILKTAISAGLVWVDPDRLVDVLEKLLDNAIRFSADGTEITLSIRRDGQFVTFHVQDQGIGIGADDLENVFEDFGQLDQSDTRRPGGAGVSLGICRYVIRQHGGRIWAESTGSGSSFFFVLPAPCEQPLLDDVESFQQLVENIRDVFWMVDVQTRKVVYASPAYEEIWQRSRESLYADPDSWMSAIHEADRERVQTARAGHLQNAYRIEYRVVRPDASERWVRDRSYCVRNEFGEVVKLVGIAEDITEQHQADGAVRLLNLELENRVAERTAEFRAIFDSTPEALVFTDPERRVRMYNAACSRLYGYEPGEIVGQSTRLFYPSTQDYETQGILHFNGEVNRDITTFEMTLKRKDGVEFPAEIIANRVFSQDGQFLGGLIIGRDLRPRRLQEQQLQQFGKMEAAGQLAGGIAHDFNNLLTVICGYTHLLLSDLDLRDPRREPLLEIAQAAERATALTGQLLTFSRRQVIRPETLDLRSVVQYSRVLLKRLVGEDVEVRLDPPDAAAVPLSVWGDRNQLEQVLMSLAGDARDAMARGGVLRLTTGAATLVAPMAVQAALLPPGEYVFLTVSDTGTGMDEATCAHIFEPFFTTKPPGEGTGLGLATVYGIVTEGQGGIVVETAPGQGTTLRIYWPRLDVEPLPPAPLSPLSGRRTVLLVEDEAAVRRLVRRVLEQQGYAVVEAVDGQDGLDRMGRTDKPIDLVVTDVVMPRMGGQEMADQVRLRYPAARILFMSGYTGDKVTRYGVEEKNVHFIRKPLVMAAFLQKVREVM